MKQPMVDTMMKDKFDNLYTPFEGIDILIPYIPTGVKKIWECTDFGGSMITTVLRDHGYTVTGTDITNGVDFLTCRSYDEFDCLISNPPYSLKDQFLERCFELGKPFALLLPLTALEGIKRGNLFRKHGIGVIVIDQRLDFTGKKSTWFNTSWFCGNGFMSENSIIFGKLNR